MIVASRKGRVGRNTTAGALEGCRTVASRKGRVGRNPPAAPPGGVERASRPARDAWVEMLTDMAITIRNYRRVPQGTRG